MQSITPYQQSGSNRSRSRYTFRHERESDLTRLGRLSQFRHRPLYCLSSDCAWVDSVQLTLSPRRLCLSHCPCVDSAPDLDLLDYISPALFCYSYGSVVPGCSGFPERVTRPCVPLLWSRACSFRYRHAVSVTWLPSSHGMAVFQCRSHAAGGSESSASRGWSADLSSMLARVWSLGGQTTRRWSGRGGSGLREGDGACR